MNKSDRWDVEMSGPTFRAWSPDAELRTIQGSEFSGDGVIGDGNGQWRLKVWSPSKRRWFEATVHENGSITTDEGEDADSDFGWDLIAAAAAEEPGVQKGLPQRWIESSQVVAVLRQHSTYGGGVDFLTFNRQEWDRSPGEAVWCVVTSGGPRHFISASGNYLGHR